MQVSFQGKPFQGLPQSQFVQGPPFQAQFPQGQPLQNQSFPFKESSLKVKWDRVSFFRINHTQVTCFNNLYNYNMVWLILDIQEVCRFNYSGYSRISWVSSSQYETHPSGLSVPSQDPNCQFTFIATLDFLDLSRLTNDPLLYLPFWTTILTNLPIDIPKFEGKSGKDPSNHVMTYHIQCTSNLLINDSIRLRLFQWILTSLKTKWYVEFPCASFSHLMPLLQLFLPYFSCPFDMIMELNF